MSKRKPEVSLEEQVIENVAAAIHAELCGCRKHHRLHGRQYMELAHVAVDATLDTSKAYREAHP